MTYDEPLAGGRNPRIPGVEQRVSHRHLPPAFCLTPPSPLLALEGRFEIEVDSNQTVPANEYRYHAPHTPTTPTRHRPPLP